MSKGKIVDLLNVARKVARAAPPPIAIRLARIFAGAAAAHSSVGDSSSAAPWFDPGGLELFCASVRKSACYVEYGCGRSTVYALQHSGADVNSVESDPAWANSVISKAGAEKHRLNLGVVDLGPLGPFGTPLAYARRHAFRDYIAYPWLSALGRADLVLIDGRFRVACFCKSMLSAQEGATILFDDYRDRVPYHLVEEVMAPVEVKGRMAKFVKPSLSDGQRKGYEDILRDFWIVRD